MTLDEARRTGMPIAVGGSTDIEDQRPDLVGPGSTAVASVVMGMDEPGTPDEVVIVHGDEPSTEFPPESAAPPASLDAEVDYLLQRIADIEAKLRAKLRLNDIHAALDRVDALLK